MKTFNEFTTEKTLQEKWEATGLLQGLSEETAIELSYALENQRLTNESSSDAPASFKRLSIPIIRRVFGIIPDLKGALQTEHHYELNVNFDAAFMPDSNTVKSSNPLDMEAEASATLSEIIAKEIKIARDQGKLNQVGNLIWRAGRIYVGVN